MDIHPCRKSELAGTNARLVFASSAEVYGPAAAAPFSETTVPQPASAYGIMKLAGENLVRLSAERGDVLAAIVRPGVVYGPGQAGMMVPDLLADILRGSKIATTAGRQTRDLLFVDDAVQGIVRAASVASSFTPVFNLGTGTSPEIRDVIRELMNVCGREVEWDDSLVYRADEIMDYRLAVNRARTELEWVAATTWREGIAQTAAALRGPG